MKTESEMIATAMRIANEGPHSRVAFFMPTWQRAEWIAKTVLDNLSLYDGALFEHQPLRYVAKDGGMLVIRAVTKEDVWSTIGGMQLTHAFHIDVCDCEEMLFHRIRSTKEHKTPPGLFGPYGVLRRTDY